jgi:hypothetical protein
MSSPSQCLNPSPKPLFTCYEPPVARPGPWSRDHRYSQPWLTENMSFMAVSLILGEQTLAFLRAFARSRTSDLDKPLDQARSGRLLWGTLWGTSGVLWGETRRTPESQLRSNQTRNGGASSGSPFRSLCPHAGRCSTGVSPMSSCRLRVGYRYSYPRNIDHTVTRKSKELYG